MRQRITFICLAVMLFAGCQGPAERPASTPADDIAVTTEDGVPYTINRDESWLHVRVYKSGRLARFGHNHIISSHAIDGSVVLADDPTDTSVSLRLALADFVVDDPRWRAQNGDDFPGAIKDADREGTRANMLSDKLLNAAAHPLVHIDSTAVEDKGGTLIVQARVRLAGATKVVAFPVNVTTVDGVVTATGEATLTHDQLGLTPFSALLGALKVADEIGVSYHLVAQPSEPST